ncbi:hypothetical protein [Microbulbifer sp. VAAF005]|uniref:hypothetical protein n=1 Tax=unclassified Microbulbifer TaxID=2619833 RepID=UPI0024ACFBAD|nr:hypothetical protein [Microbulbifer sp. VAAF005]WHI47266.1 hypothetical protein P0078_02495 [Microbulbifer sp. VAAF005]
MKEVYFLLFFLALPIMSLGMNIFTVGYWLLRKRFTDSKKLSFSMVVGGVLGYIIAAIYFFSARGGGLVETLNLSSIGVLVGAGYVSMLCSLWLRYK